MVGELKRSTIVSAVALAALLAPATALGETEVVYPQDQNTRSFTTNDGGWERGVERTGLCLPPLTCPAIGGSYVAKGGASGASDGYLETTIAGLAGVGSESRAILRSPVFAYNGVNGERPDELTFSIAYLSRLSFLLQATGNRADFTVEVVRAANGKGRAVVDQQELVASEGWNDKVVSLNPRELNVGEGYRIRITTRFIYGAQVLEGGSVGYDDVVLTAVSNDEDGGAPGGPGGGRSNPGGGSATFDGRNLFIKLKCFGVKNKKGKCHTRATALKSKGGTRYTFPIQRVVKAKKGKVVRARVRFKFRKELEQRNSIVLKSVLRTSRQANTKVAKFEKLKLIQRGN